MKTLRSSNNENDISLFWRLYSYLAITPMYDTIYIIGLIIFESILCYIIIEKVSYTEIDWKAYMEEVEMWYIDGEYDYRKIRGGTGPLVYPAGFLYLFWWFRYMTNNGTNIRVAQYIFYVLYLLTQLAVCWIYQCTVTFLRQRHHASQPEEQQSKLSSSWQFCHQIWSWRVAMLILCLSKRMHSIFVLRLFNDGPTMLLLYVSILLFIHNKWNWGCIVFSFAVSIKMNVLLFAPGLLLLLLQIGPNLMTVVMRLLFCCAVPQLILGAPFLLSHPISYLRKAFELDRVFFYEWTVNLKVRSRNKINVMPSV